MKKKPQINPQNSEINPAMMSVIGHLEELRRRLIYILVVIIIGAIVSLVFIKPIILFLRAPIQDLNLKLYYFKPYEKLTTYFKIAIFTSMVITMPFILYQISAFIVPGLYKKEKKLYFVLILFVLFLFLLGAFFCYKMIAPVSFRFFVEFMQGDDVMPLWGIKDYFGLLTLLVFFTGIIFQLPLIMMILARFGVVTGDGLAKVRRHAIVIIFIVAAVITPPDVLSQILLAIPTVILFEISILLARIMTKRRKKLYYDDMEEDKAEPEIDEPEQRRVKDTYDYNPYDKEKM